MNDTGRWGARRIVTVAFCIFVAGSVLWLDWSFSDALSNGILLLIVIAAGLAIANSIVPGPDDDEYKLGKLPSRVREWRKLREGMKAKR